MKILIFAPHIDDELIGCGGTILKNIKKNNEIEIIFITSGRPEERDIRKKEVKEIYEKLGIKYYFMDEKDRFIEYNERILRQIIKKIREISPNKVYFPHENEEDRDHQAVNRILKEACWISGTDFFPELGNPANINKIFHYEVWTPMDHPTYYEDISNFLNKKIRLLKKYKSQIKSKRYDLAAQGLNNYRGVMGINTKAAEAFKIEFL